MKENVEKKPKKEKKTKTVQAEAINITESISSVKLTRTAGGEVRPEVKVYDVNPQKAAKTCSKIMDDLNKKYKVNE